MRAAIALADERGLGAAGVRQVAERLRVTPMALYRHLGGKEGLLDGMADALYAEIELPRPDADWWTGLDRLAHSTRSVLPRASVVGAPLLEALHRPAR